MMRINHFGVTKAKIVSPPKVKVLMATYNGRRWIREQIDSILSQVGVNTEIMISDDWSTDGTRELLEVWAAENRRITLLPIHTRFGSAAANFYHLLSCSDTGSAAFLALSDQDDIWELDKLQRHIALLRSTGASGVSSDVTAFWPDGHARLIKKSQVQRRWDHILEPPGPGCTFLMTPELVHEVVYWIDTLTAIGIGPLPKHDWFIYLVARSSGLSWHIDEVSSVRYRQHENNEVGANAGIGAKLRRASILLRGEYQRNIRHAMQIGRLVSAHAQREGPPSRFTTFDLLVHGRRRFHEALMLALFAVGRL